MFPGQKSPQPPHPMSSKGGLTNTYSPIDYQQFRVASPEAHLVTYPPLSLARITNLVPLRLPPGYAFRVTN